MTAAKLNYMLEQMYDAMKRPSENLSPHFQEMVARFREAQARSQEQARENEAFAQRIRDLQTGSTEVDEAFRRADQASPNHQPTNGLSHL
jgi:predicted nuclease with TOPRIM domain